jgi:thiol-disulfide isomerase/thioredoxin
MAQYKTISEVGADENAPDPRIMAAVPRIQKPEHREALLKNHKLVIIDNYTDWCGPCKQCAPQFANLASKYSRPGLCAFAKENVEDKVPGQSVAIRGVPCFHFYVDGVVQPEMTITGGDIASIENSVKSFFGVNQ